MTSLASFPDTEIELLSCLGPIFPDYRFGTKMPGKSDQITVSIHRISGANRNLLIDRPIVDIDVFSPSGETAANNAARAIQAALLGLAGARTMNGVIQRVATVNGPHWLPEDNQELIRYGATYEIFIRAA